MPSTNSSRRGLAAVLAATALAILPASPAAAAEPDPLEALGRVALRAIGSAGVDGAVDRLGQGLALQAAQQRVAAADARRAEEAASAPAPDFTDIEDPSELPPASGGFNGTEYKREAQQRGGTRMFANSPGGDPESNAILLTGIALAPPNAPEAVKGVINNANRIVGRPYVWGGGHGSWYSHGYDCSGAVSFALYGGGLIPRPLTSGELEGWGAPGEGEWITVYANATHTWAEIAGLRWDTSGTERGTGPRWHVHSRPTEGFVARHPPGF